MGKKTKTGYSTAADVFEKLAPDYPVVHDILEYRQLTKLNSTYAGGFYMALSGMMDESMEPSTRQLQLPDVSAVRNQTCRISRSVWN